MDGDLRQRNLANGIHPDLPRHSGSPDGSGRERLDDAPDGTWRERLDDGLESRMEHNELLVSSNQIGRAIEAFSNTQLQHLRRFFNQGPASAAVNGGELFTGGILQLYDRGVGRGDGIGNGFGANDQEPSSASINGELGTTYVRSSDYFRHVRTENGAVYFHMNSFVNVDGRVYNLTQEPHLNNRGSSQLINKVMLAITGQTVGFITTMISMLLRTRKPRASGVLTKVGAVAGSSAIILAMGMAFHMSHIWAFLFLCIIAAAVVLFGQT